MSEPDTETEFESPFEPPSGWSQKFRHAFRGLIRGITSQSSFKVHLPIAAIVLATGCYFQASLIEICILLLCIALVVSLELLNSGLEFLAREVTQNFSERIKAALDISAAAVLVASCFSALIGLLILLPRIYAQWFACAA